MWNVNSVNGKPRVFHLKYKPVSYPPMICEKRIDGSMAKEKAVKGLLQCRAQTSGCTTAVMGRNTWARLPAATQENHPAARWWEGTLEQDSLQLLGGQNIPKRRSYKMLLQAKREPPYRLLNDESVPTATLLLLDAVHCNSRDPSSPLLRDLIWLQGDSLTVCKKHMQYSEWSRWYIKLESVLGRQRLHYSEDIEKQSIKQKDNSVNGEPLYKT